MANGNRSRKGKTSAKPSGAAGGSNPPKGLKGTAKAPSSPRHGDAPVSKAAVLIYLAKQGADAALLSSVSRLQQAGPSTATTSGQQNRPSASCQQLVRLVTSHVQYVRQLRSWERVPPFLADQVNHLAASIRLPGGPNDAFLQAVRVHGDDFCRAVQRTTRQQLEDQCTAVRRSLVAWRDRDVIDEAKQIALKRLNNLYGKKSDADRLPTLVDAALEVIPQRDPLSWADQAELEETANANSMSTD